MDTVAAPVKLTTAEVEKLDAYALIAVLGKRVIHPGGRRSTHELFQRASIKAGQEALDVGCGVRSTAIETVQHFGAQVTAADMSPSTLERARAKGRAASG